MEAKERRGGKAVEELEENRRRNGRGRDRDETMKTKRGREASSGGGSWLDLELYPARSDEVTG